jgi:hypothetical protein
LISSHICWLRFFVAVKREAVHKPPSNADAKNEWSYTPAPPTSICLHGVGSDSWAIYW